MQVRNTAKNVSELFGSLKSGNKGLRNSRSEKKSQLQSTVLVCANNLQLMFKHLIYTSATYILFSPDYIRYTSQKIILSYVTLVIHIWIKKKEETCIKKHLIRLSHNSGRNDIFLLMSHLSLCLFLFSDPFLNSFLPNCHTFSA